MFRVLSIIFFVCVVFFLPFYFRSDSVKFDASIKTSVIFLCIGIFIHLSDRITIAKSKKCSFCNRKNATQIVGIGPIVKAEDSKSVTYETGDFEMHIREGKTTLRPVKKTKIVTTHICVVKYTIGCRICNAEVEIKAEKKTNYSFWRKSAFVEFKKMNELPVGGIVDFEYPFESDVIERIYQRKPWPLG